MAILKTIPKLVQDTLKQTECNRKNKDRERKKEKGREK
jgi:hypothetical protein